LAALGEANEEQVAAVVAKLSNPETRILRQVEAPAGQPTVSRFEIFHDVLAAAVLAWGAQYRQARSAREAAERAAREAAEQAREAARQRDLEQARALAEERDRRLRLSKRTTWGLSVLTVLSIILAIRACTLTTIARRAEAKAEKNRDEAVKAGEHERDALAREKDERKRANDEEKLAKERLDEALRLLKLTAKDNPKEAYTQTVAAVPALRSERAPEAVEELLEDPRLTIKRKAHDGAVNDMAFGPRGSRLATAGEDGAVQLWEDAEHIDKPRTILQPAGPGRPVCGIAFSRDEDGRYLVAASATGIAILWDLAAGSPPVASFTGHRGPVRDVTFSADGTRLATAGDDGTAKVWDFKTRKVLKTLEGHEGAVLRVYFNRSGDHDPRKEKLFITAGADGMARVWDATTYEPLYVLRHGARINSVTVSADGKRVATAGADRTVKIWDARSSGSLVTAFGRGIHEDEILCVAFSRDDKGRYLATASKDKTARVWDGIDARPLLTLRHDKAVHVIRFSPVATTRSQAKGGRLPEPISSLLLSQPVQSWIVTGSADGFIRVFPVSLGDLRKLDWTQQSRD
jgi:WD40 repeat protein